MAATGRQPREGPGALVVLVVALVLLLLALLLFGDPTPGGRPG